MTTGQHEGFNYGMENIFGGDVEDDDDDNFTIDADDLLKLLDEEFVPDQPADLFYASTDNTQESSSVILLDDQMDTHFQTDCAAASENSTETVEAEQLPFSSSLGMVPSEANDSSLSGINTQANTCQAPNFVDAENFPLAQDWNNFNNFSSDFPDQNFVGVNYDLMSGYIKNDIDNSLPSQSWSKLAIESQVGAANFATSEVQPPHMFNFLDVKGHETHILGNNPVNHIDRVNTFGIKDEINNKIFSHKGFECKSFEANGEGPLDVFSFGAGRPLSSTGSQYTVYRAGGPPVYWHNSAANGKVTNMQLMEDPSNSADLNSNIGSSYCNTEGEKGRFQAAFFTPNILGGTLEASQTGLLESRSDIDDDTDLCIIEDVSEPARILPFSARGKSVAPQPAIFTPQHSTFITPFNHMGSSGTRMKGSDERLVLQSLVQDLSQPKSEASPPDGVLAVPLLRHQRIALSWMVQKETNSLHCSGGILADDQGLGKTVSTIALILTERPMAAQTVKGKDQGEPVTLDLDEDDDKQMGNKVASSSVKGRPSGGTLVVCPTSVLRQWAEELKTKVTSEGNLSVNVYHGSNRIKDPYELANYDVVLTTYSIVSMEVPKQTLQAKDADDGQNSEVEEALVQINKKRKQSSTSDKKRSKRGMDNASVESVVRPLAKVGWFRVVLDEAQSIKNHRTRVAQACWGLRAKRRWCLSGTPIQNAVDDLYSYFRFLKYDPYCVYKSFYSMVKLQIQKTPSKGYQKLQAVLKNIMLRRTKGTLLDGKPIINLPPKSVNLKKVEFSDKERDFYRSLEADSRAQFQAYAESGTVKQNYVNILLMLLRLRQACDHPFLVQGYDSSSILKSSLHIAEKLPQEQKISLLKCLEASLAICGICKDPPEDAVVSICGHVFCNQCISERFTGDENQCPATICKKELSASTVFSKGTLKSCLYNQDRQDSSHAYPASGSSDQRELIAPQPSGQFESSKIKAALEYLHSLSRPYDVNNVSKQPVIDAHLLDQSDTASCVADNENSNSSNCFGDTNSSIKEKTIVFSQWTRMLDLLEDRLKESSIQYRRLDGTMSVVSRDKAVRDFNTLPEVTVMIMSLKAASLGLNMVAACHVLLLDLWWNPTTEDQAIDRAHRIGQTRPVTVVRLTVKDTVEDRILALQQKKRELVASAFGEDEKNSRQSRLTVEDLTYLFMA
ncbi:unnamed protein product [Amaranthus hypochondriacus]